MICKDGASRPPQSYVSHLMHHLPGRGRGRHAWL